MCPLSEQNDKQITKSKYILLCSWAYCDRAKTHCTLPPSLYHTTCFFETFLPKLSTCLWHKNNLSGIPNNPPSETQGPNKQPSAVNLFHHAPANISSECVNVCLWEGGGCGSRARVLHLAQTREYPPAPLPLLYIREALQPVLSAPLNTLTYYCAPALCSWFCPSDAVAAAPAFLPVDLADSQHCVGGWVEWRGGLGALKLSSGAPVALPAHPS